MTIWSAFTRPVWIGIAGLLSGCAHVWLPAVALDPEAAADARVRVPRALAALGDPVADADPDHARAGLTAAVKAPGAGGVSEGYVVRLAEDLPVYRLWNGPEVVDARGFTNRLGPWWAAEAPRGSEARYREDYAVCEAWNQLRFEAACTLKAGAVLVIGPGQSVSADTCGAPAESYAAQPDRWQIYIHQPWARGEELVCPPEAQDRPVDARNLRRRPASP